MEFAGELLTQPVSFFPQAVDGDAKGVFESGPALSERIENPRLRVPLRLQGRRRLGPGPFDRLRRLTESSVCREKGSAERLEDRRVEDRLVPGDDPEEAEEKGLERAESGSGRKEGRDVPRAVLENGARAPEVGERRRSPLLHARRPPSAAGPVGPVRERDGEWP